MGAWWEPLAGALIIVLVLADVFLTVLYARMGAGLLASRLAAVIWSGCRRLATNSRRPGAFLSFCGPAILLCVLALWAAGLTLGTALVIHPALGHAVRSENGPTPTDFVSALYVGANSVSIVGSGGMQPHTTPFRLFFILDSLLGTSVITLALSYLMQIYTALQRRNALGLRLHLASGGTGDAADLLARLGPQGRFEGGYTNISQLATDVAAIKEAHHFYPVLFYFRFEEPYYSVSFIATISLDLVSLLRSGLDDDRLGWLKSSGPVEELWRGAMLLVTSLERNFGSGGVAEPTAPEPQAAAWQRRFQAGLRRLKDAGIATTPDEPSGARQYQALRARWNQHIAGLAPRALYSADEIDPAGGHGAGTAPDAPELVAGETCSTGGRS
jgi:hypothetical protein